MKRRKQIGKLIYTPRWDQGDIVLSDDYEGLTREEKLEVLAHWITELLSKRNVMITNPKSFHHFMGDKSWEGLTDEDCNEVERWVEFKEEGSGRIPNRKLIRYIEAKLKEKNT